MQALPCIFSLLAVTPAAQKGHSLSKLFVMNVVLICFGWLWVPQFSKTHVKLFEVLFFLPSLWSRAWSTLIFWVGFLCVLSVHNTFLIIQTEEWVEPTAEAVATTVRVIRVSIFFPWKKGVLDNFQNVQHHRQQDGRLQWSRVMFLSASYRCATAVTHFSSHRSLPELAPARMRTWLLSVWAKCFGISERQNFTNWRWHSLLR